MPKQRQTYLLEDAQLMMYSIIIILYMLNVLKRLRVLRKQFMAMDCHVSGPHHAELVAVVAVASWRLSDALMVMHVALHSCTVP
jgi:hypothetical protein